MKVEELMVGDFVIDDGVRTRIDEMDFVLNSDKLSPVPLSEEILVKSEFVKTGSTDEVCYRYSKGTDDYYSRVEISPQRGEWFVHAQKFGISNISYNREFEGVILFLHELQHILRVTGIEKEVKV
jgi:hypothetical protein